MATFTNPTTFINAYMYINSIDMRSFILLTIAFCVVGFSSCKEDNPERSGKRA